MYVVARLLISRGAEVGPIEKLYHIVRVDFEIHVPEWIDR